MVSAVAATVADKEVRITRSIAALPWIFRRCLASSSVPSACRQKSADKHSHQGLRESPAPSSLMLCSLRHTQDPLPGWGSAGTPRRRAHDPPIAPSIKTAPTAHSPPFAGGRCNGRSKNLPIVDLGRIDETQSTCMPAQVIEPPNCATTLRER
ncbi:hypothetical protein D3C80_876290 [compost metagenome]